MSALAHLPVAVLMRLEPVQGPMSRWQPWRWVLDQVFVQEESPSDLSPRCVRTDEQGRAWWLHPGLFVELHRDDAEGYYLNLSTPAPAWFVLWRMEDEPSVHEAPLARPEVVSLSYHDAGRWLDAQETVEQVPASPEVVALLQDFVAHHYQPEPKRRKRPESFKTLTDRFGNPVSISTHRPRRGGGE